MYYNILWCFYLGKVDKMELDAQVFFDNLDFEEMNYYFHITGQGQGKKIVENGLFMAESKLSSTLNELQPSELNNVDEFIVRRGNQIAKNNE